MRVFWFAVPLLALAAQGPDLTDVQRALVGSWTGVLEYRDYSEPPTSTKRVKLPTWLTVEADGADLKFNYIYDDGPTKTVTGTDRVHFDPTAAAAELKAGLGSIVVMGAATENDKPVRSRTTWRIGRNIVEFTEETAPEGQPFAFRHSYLFVRATAPVVKK
jgi:hypothetical protein